MTVPRNAYDHDQGGARPRRTADAGRLWTGGAATALARWLDMVDTANPREALGLGVALAVLNPNIPILLGGLP